MNVNNGTCGLLVQFLWWLMINLNFLLFFGFLELVGRRRKRLHQESRVQVLHAQVRQMPCISGELYGISCFNVSFAMCLA
mgnify:CR=1 FL=1